MLKVSLFFNSEKYKEINGSNKITSLLLYKWNVNTLLNRKARNLFLCFKCQIQTDVLR